VSSRCGSWSRALLAGVALVGFAVGCTATGNTPDSTGADPAPGVSSTTTPGSTAQSTGTVEWQECGSLECGRIRVPLDYDEPGGEKIELTAWRRPADAPSEKIGTLFVNPGGPGGTGEAFMETVEYMLLPSDITDRFDIVGFDPRGTGESAPLGCSTHLQEMYDADPTIEDRADRENLLGVSEEFVDECERNAGRELPHVGTLDVARDLDEWRKAVGDEQLTYVGYSYGSSIGQMYAQLFPTSIRAMVLDGVVDTEQTGLAAAEIQAGGFEDALHAFFDDCEQDSTCPIASDPEKLTARVIAKAEKEPIPAPEADRPATPGVVQLGIGQALYAKSLWPSLADALEQADKGDATGLVDLADAYLQREPDGQYPFGFDLYFAVSCLDSEWPGDPDAVLAAAKRIGRKYPFMGEGLVNDYVRCGMWPAKPQPLPALTAEGSPPILVVSTTGDAATPYENGVTVAERLPQGVLLTNEGDTHTIFGQGKSCIDDAVATYLVDLDPPKDDTRCD